MKKIITLHRRSLDSHLPDELLEDSVKRLGSIYVGAAPLNPINKLSEEVKKELGVDIKKVLYGYLQVDPDDQKRMKTISDFWANFTVNVPPEGYQMDITVMDGYPTNALEYLQYVFCLAHPYVSASKEQILNEPRAKFYLINPIREQEKRSGFVKEQKQAIVEFAKIAEDDAKIREVLRAFGKPNVSRFSDDEASTELYEIAADSPKEFTDMIRSKSIEEMALLTQLLDSNVITRIGQTYMYADDLIANSKDEMIVFLRNTKRNSKVITEMKAKMKNNVIPA